MAETSPGGRERPLSPHTGIWRWHVTMATSILHRAAGTGLYLGLLILAGWAWALASGRQTYDAYASLWGSIPGELLLFAITTALFFHMAMGVQHLVWDFGKGFAPKTANRTAWAAIIFAAVAAVAVWAVIALSGGR